MKSFIRALGHLSSLAFNQDDTLLLPFEKRERLAKIATHYNVNTFVETGSYHGETAIYMAQIVSKVFSIEIDLKNSEIARRRCEARSNVEIRTGSSEVLLPEIVRGLKGSTLFWLDAHYQNGMARGRKRCPLFEEIETILSAENIIPIIVVDDARKFIWVNGWPSLRAIKSCVVAKRKNFSFRISNDMICIGPFSM
jgi:hypothetical protein